MYFTWQPERNRLHPGDGTEGRKMEIHPLNVSPFSITQKQLAHGCVSPCVFVFLLKKGIALKYNTIFEEMGKRKFENTLYLVLSKSCSVLLDTLIRRGAPSFYRIQKDILLECYLKVLNGFMSATIG